MVKILLEYEFHPSLIVQLGQPDNFLFIYNSVSNLRQELYCRMIFANILKEQ